MTQQFVFANNAGTTLGSPVNTTQTTITLSSGAGSLFPSPTGSQQFAVSMLDALTRSVYEIMYCTSRTGDVLTVLRAQEGTTARSWLAGDFVNNYITAGTAANFAQGNNYSYAVNVQDFTATAGQTVFTLTSYSYIPGTNTLSVYVNGLKQILGESYTETSSTSFTFVNGLNVGAHVQAIFGNVIPTAVSSASVGYNEGGTGAVTTTVQAKLQQTVSVKDFGVVGNGTTDDTSAIQAAFTALAGSEGTGYGANPAILDLNGLNILFTGTLYVPTNVSLKNGSFTSASGKLVWRNPYLANTGGRTYTAYWPYMTSRNESVLFNCIVVINVYIGAKFSNCDFNGLVLVNSNSLWTEYNSFNRCSFYQNTTTGSAIRFDGNISGTSTWSTGTGVGTSGGSFGYSNFESNCKIDSTAPQVGLSIVDGGTLYNAHLGFQGYARNAGPSGGFLYIDSSVNVSTVSQCVFEVHLESLGAASNVISLSTNSKFWYNLGNIQSASPQMVMAQAGTVDIRANQINVIGIVLNDSAGNSVFNGPSYMTTITTDLNQRQWIQPKFAAYASTNQTFSSNVITKLTFGTEEFDTGSYFATSRFTPQVAGYYQINARGSYNMTATTTAAWVAIYKNGSVYRYGNQDTPINDCARTVSSIVYFNGSTDYVEIYGYVFDNAGAPNTISGIAETYFNGSFVGY